MAKLTKAVSWKVKRSFKKRSIQLFDVNGRRIEGDKSFWEGDFDCKGMSLTSLSGAPKLVTGDFICHENKLTSLEGGPVVVEGSLQCSSNRLKSLKGIPQSIGLSIYCQRNMLTSLEGMPSEVNGSFICYKNKIKFLKGCPNLVDGHFSCSENELTSLIDGPQVVNGHYHCANNKLTNLKGAPESVEAGFDCSFNNLATLEGSPRKVGDRFTCDSNKLTSLTGAPELVGMDFVCFKNELISLEGLPQLIGQNFLIGDCKLNKLNISNYYQNIGGKVLYRETPRSLSTSLVGKTKEEKFAIFLNKGFLLADGQLHQVIKSRTSGSNTIYKIKEISREDELFCVQQGFMFAHGKTLKSAYDDLLYKLGFRDLSEFSSWKYSDVRKTSEIRSAYKKVTGACNSGIESFIERNQLNKEEYVLNEIVELTRGHYGHDDFRNFLSNKEGSNQGELTRE